MAISLKDNTVNPSTFSAPLVLALVVANEVYKEHGADLVITSGNDATHYNTSLHYAGEAADLRIRDLSVEVLGEVTGVIKKRLGRNFDVVLEKDHIHLEHQPRRPV